MSGNLLFVDSIDLLPNFYQWLEVSRISVITRTKRAGRGCTIPTYYYLINCVICWTRSVITSVIRVLTIDNKDFIKAVANRNRLPGYSSELSFGKIMCPSSLIFKRDLDRILRHLSEQIKLKMLKEKSFVG